MAEFLARHFIAIVAVMGIIVMAVIVTFVVRSASNYWQKHWPENQSQPDREDTENER